MQIKNKLTLLASQSIFEYQLLKDEKTKLYYIRRTSDKKETLLGDRDDAEIIILYG